LQRITEHGPVFYQFDQWHRTAAITHGVFSRLGGVSRAPWTSLNVGSTVGDDPEAVTENKRLMYRALDVDPAEVCTVWQVHGNTTLVANPQFGNGADLPQADGLVTDQPGVALVMRFADCVPILFYDPVKRVVGMAHAGWRGTVAGAGPSVVRKMIALHGSNPADIQAGIGPSIGPDRYEVGAEVVQAVRDAFGSVDGLILYMDDGHTFLNLWEANRQALAAEGLSQVEIAGICTAAHTDEFFSHRAEHGKTGRFGAAIALAVS
jgi:YfiH family protein